MNIVEKKDLEIDKKNLEIKVLKIERDLALSALQTAKSFLSDAISNICEER